MTIDLAPETLADLRHGARLRIEAGAKSARTWDADRLHPTVVLALLDRIEALERDALEVTGAFNER